MSLDTEKFFGKSGKTWRKNKQLIVIEKQTVLSLSGCRFRLPAK